MTRTHSDADPSHIEDAPIVEIDDGDVLEHVVRALARDVAGWGRASAYPINADELLALVHYLADHLPPDRAVVIPMPPARLRAS